jgi:hypothetical protein
VKETTYRTGKDMSSDLEALGASFLMRQEGSAWSQYEVRLREGALEQAPACNQYFRKKRKNWGTVKHRIYDSIS